MLSYTIRSVAQGLIKFCFGSAAQGEDRSDEVDRSCEDLHLVLPGGHADGISIPHGGATSVPRLAADHQLLIGLDP